MRFNKIKTRKTYETWSHWNRRTGIIVYIYKTPKNIINCNDNEYYHFAISCARSKISDINYSSLNNKKLYETFEKTKAAIMEWWHENLIG